MAIADELAAAEAAKKRAENEATQAKLDEKLAEAEAASRSTSANLPEGHVRVRITKAGDNKVHTGGKPRRAARDGDGEIYEGDDIFPKYRKGEIVVLPKKVAESLEGRLYAEIED